MIYIVPISYAVILFTAIILKITGVFGKEAASVLMKIVLNVTLPAAVICAFDNISGGGELLTLIFAGLLFSLIPFLLAFVFTFKAEKNIRAFYMFNAGGYNIGCFSLSIVSGVFGGTGGVAACLFDTGNAIVVTGGSYAAASGMLGFSDNGSPFLTGIKRLFSSIPFDTYLLMLVLTVFSLKIPVEITSLLKPAAQANGFLAMFTVGLLFDKSGLKSYVRSVIVVCVIRLVFAVASAFAVYYLFPYDDTVKKALIFVLFSPTSALAPIFCEKLCDEGARAGAVSSATVVLSIIYYFILTAILT